MVATRVPSTPPTHESGSSRSRAHSGLSGKLALARAILQWERVWPSLWPPIVIVATFLAVALMGVPGWVGDLTRGWGHLALLILAAAAFLWSVRRGVLRWEPASGDDAVRRLERDSGLMHRPVSTMADRPAGTSSDPLSAAVWRAHQERLARRLRDLKVAPPEPSMATLDRFGFRAALALALVVGLAVATPDPGARVAAAFLPQLKPLHDVPPPTLDVWINPPAYTGQVPILLARAGDGLVRGGAPAADLVASEGTPVPERLAVPDGSILLAKVNGGEGVPVLIVDREETPASEAFETVAPRAHQIERTISEGTALTIRQDGEDLASWTITVIPDLKPTVALAEPPSATERSALMIHYTAADDYGVTAVEARIQRLDSTGSVTADEAIVLPLTLPGVAPEAIDAKDFHDLTPHPWAGQPVQIGLVARDQADQQGFSDTLRIVLPERQFTHPIARAIIEQRKRLTTEPQEKADIAQILMSIAIRPHHYYDDIVTFLALRTAAGRLVLNDVSDEMVGAVQRLLWDTALRVEDGELSLAARELRELERQIMDLLAQEDLDERELEALLDELKEAIDKFLQAMAEQMQDMMQQDGGETAEQMEPVDPNRVLQRQDLMDMVERAREMMKAGAKDAARQMLSQLREMMENLRAGRPQLMSPEQLAAREMMRQLQDLAEQQQRLMDESFKRHQNGDEQFGNRGQQQRGNQPFGQRPGQQQGQQQFGQQPGQRGQRPGQQGQRGQPGQPTPGLEGLSAEQLAQMQEDLRRQLGEFMRKLGEGMGQIPQPFGEAERAMKDAADALGNAQPGEAVGPQGDAIERLQDGAQALSEAMRQQQQAGGGQAPDPNAQGQARDGERRDPLRDDQNNNGMAVSEEGVTVPTESDLQRARRIFDELRRRSGERERPTLELDYIDRLLKRF